MQGQILGLINPAIALLFAAAFAALWSRDRSARYIAVLAFGYVCLAFGFLVFHFTPDPNGTASILLMHLFYSAGALSLCWAVLQRAGLSMLLRVPLGMVALTAVGLYLTSFADDQNARLYAANSCYGLLFALAAQVLARAGRREAVDRLLLWLFAVTALQFFVRPYVAILVEGGMSAQEYRDSAFYAVMIVTVGVISLMLAMVLVAACVADQMQALREEGASDALTGLQSRRSFERDAMAMIDRAQTESVPVSVVVADIDYFKRVNDMWGHQVGDNAIAAFGRLLADTVRATDRVGRIGGEEFCILVWDCEGAAAASLAERIRRGFGAVAIEGMAPDIRLTASFGVAEWRVGEGYGRLFARADAALYAAKENGRDRVEREAGKREAARLAAAA